MGFECAASIAKKGGNVIIATPTMERAQGAAEKIKVIRKRPTVC